MGLPLPPPLVPTQDITVRRVLRQGDPWPLLFIIATEELAGLDNKEAELGQFQAYKVCLGTCYPILQFADNTVRRRGIICGALR